LLCKSDADAAAAAALVLGMKALGCR